MKLRITIISKQVVEFDAGDIPANLIKDLLTKNDGTFDGNWSPSDLRGDDRYTTESIEVEEV